MNEVKVYLDYQIWDYINKIEYVKQYFQRQKEEKGWRYFISVAHLEELFKARKNETAGKSGRTDLLELTMRSMSENGIIKPTIQGVKYIPNGYEKAYQDIVKNDTSEVVRARSEIRRKKDREGYDPKDLFAGMAHKQEEEYKVVWETERVKREMEQLQAIQKQLRMSLLLPENPLVEALKNIYGEFEAYNALIRQLNSLDVEIKSGIYQDIRDDYGKLEFVIEQLYIVLTKCGFKRDGSDKKANSGTYDIQHSICATLCDIFITYDKSFLDKFRAVAYFLEIPVRIIGWDEINGTIPKENPL